jgi:hypothetical protein
MLWEIGAEPQIPPLRYPGFAIRSAVDGHGCGFLRKNKFSIKPSSVFGTAGSTTKRRVPHPLRFLQRVGYATVGIEVRGIPPFAKARRMGQQICCTFRPGTSSPALNRSDPVRNAG